MHEDRPDPAALDIVSRREQAQALVVKSVREASEPNRIYWLMNTDMEAAALAELASHPLLGLIYATINTRLVDPPDALMRLPTVLLNCHAPNGALTSVVPARWRSRIKDNSISATMPSTVRTIRPIGPPVSIAGSRTLRFAPFCSSSCTRLRTSRVERPSLSSLTTISVSPDRIAARGLAALTAFSEPFPHAPQRRSVAFRWRH